MFHKFLCLHLQSFIDLLGHHPQINRIIFLGAKKKIIKMLEGIKNGDKQKAISDIIIKD